MVRISARDDAINLTFGGWLTSRRPGIIPVCDFTEPRRRIWGDGLELVRTVTSQAHDVLERHLIVSHTRCSTITSVLQP